MILKEGDLQMGIYGNMVGSSGGTIGKTVEIISDDGVSLMGVVVDQEQILDAKPSDIRIGKIAATDSGIVEGTNTITYRTIILSELFLPGETICIYLPQFNMYDYTKIQCIVTLFEKSYVDSAVPKYITIDDNVFSIDTHNKVSSITKNATDKTIELNITNNSEDVYEIFFATYHEEE